MSDYIKRKDAQRALVHTLKDAEIDNACNEQDWYCQGLMDAGVAIDDVPSADVVEVVRCKYCKYNNGAHKCLNENSIIKIPKDTDYCSYGRLKEQKSLFKNQFRQG